MKLLKKELDAEKAKKAAAVNDLSGKMDTVVTSMTSTESQLKDLEKQALQLQRIAEQEAQEKSCTRGCCSKNKQSKLLKMRKLNQHKRHQLSQRHQQTTVDKLKKEEPKKGRA